MWPYHPDLLETPVPRYTSYPTAADFGALPTGSLARAVNEASGDISLYLHIPFCETICFYCGCNTSAAGRTERVQSYLTALHEEIVAVGEELGPGAKVRRIAFGGGSPNAIAPRDFLALVDALHAHFPLTSPDLSIEIDPRTFSQDWAQAIEDAGVRRASLGVQTFAEHCQKAIGREQSEALIARSVDWLRQSGVRSLNFDLMYGLPHQTMADLIESLARTSHYGADRIALFGYAHVPHIVKRQRVIDAETLPGRETRFAMAKAGLDALISSGYQAIGFDHFAKPQDPMAIAAREGALRRNFQGFTEDTSDILIGLGASAISVFPELIAQNEKNTGRYRMHCSQGAFSASEGIVRSREDAMRGQMIEGLLCHGEVDLSPCLFSQIEPRLRPFRERGLATLDGLTLRIAPEGLPYARVIAAMLDPYREKTTQRFSSAI